MSEALQAWIHQTAASPGIIACGVRTPDRAIQVKSYRQELAEMPITQAVRELSETILALQQNQLCANHLRWTFEGGQICCTSGPGGALAILVVDKTLVNRPESERLLADCPLLRGGE